MAQETARRLEQAGLSCWISLRDVLPGHNYQESIIEALDQARALVFLFSHASAASSEVKKELSVAASLNIPVFPVRLSAVTPTGALRYELATRQWIDIFDDADAGFAKLIAAIAPKPPGRALTPSSPEFEAIRALLARHIGPIAKIVLQKAATEAGSVGELCDRLAEYVASPAERGVFLQEVRARLRK